MPDLFVSPESTDNANTTINDTQLNGSSQPVTLPPQHNAHFFTTYCEYPKNIHFGTQEPNEQILLFLRRDFITNIPWVISSIILAVAPMLLSAVATTSGLDLSV